MHEHRLVMVVVLCLALTTTALAQQAMTENFDGGQPQNWELLDGAQLMQQERMGTVLGFGQHGFAIWQVETGNSFALQFSLMLQQEGMFGVIFRNSGEPPNHSEYQVTHDGGRFRLMKVANGQETELASGNGLQPGVWATVSMQVSAGQITVTANNQQVLSATDPQPLAQGGLAFHGQSAFVDNVSLTGGGIPIQTISQPTGGGGGGGIPPESGGGGLSNAFGQISLGQNVSGVFLYLEGIPGSAAQQGVKGWIQCTDWQFTVNANASRAPEDHALTVIKAIDRSTPKILEACASNKTITAARLITASNGRITFDMVMRNPVRILSAGRSALNGLDQQNPAPYDFVTLRSDDIEWRVPIYGPDGKPSGTVPGQARFSAN